MAAAANKRHEAAMVKTDERCKRILQETI